MKKPNEQLWIDEEERKRRPISVHDAQPARCCRQIKSPTATAQTFVEIFVFFQNFILFINRKQTFRYNRNHVLSVSGRLRCSRCEDELGQGSAMVIESLGLYYHIECFRCFVCNIPLTSSFEGTDVRVRNHRLHCPNCFSDDNGKSNDIQWAIEMSCFSSIGRSKAHVRRLSTSFSLTFHRWY